jgi:glycosyltransferase involved in cell wall biosynthesis
MKLKKICIDATLLKDNRLTGIERYTIELIKSLYQINTEYTIYILLSKGYTRFEEQINVGIPIYSPFNNRILTDQFWITFITYKIKADLVHFPVFGAPVFCRIPTVLTIHDATPWKFPETISNGVRFYYKPLFKQSIDRAKHIITVSNSSRDDLMSMLKISPEKITTIYEAVDTAFFSSDNIHVPENFELNFQYILSVGTLEPRKNIEVLIQAFILLKKQYGIPHKLVFTGRKGWIDALNIPEAVRDQIIFTGFIPDHNLPAIYQKAAAFVFPSKYEGFGFPILEAFALKVPVVCSNTSSLPEIGGEGCLYADVNSPQDFADKIYTLIADNKVRNTLVQKGTEILKKFSWSMCGRETLQVYNNAI